MGNEVLELLKTEIGQIKEAVASRAAGGVVDVDALIAGVVAGLAAQQKDILERQEANRPMYPGARVGPPGFEVPSLGVVQRGKFAGKRVEDVVFAYNFLKRVHPFEPSKVTPPSQEMEAIVTRALTSTGSGTGDEYVPTNMAATLWEDAFLASKIVGALGGGVDMPTDPWDWPVSWGAVTWRKGTQNTAATVSDPATAKSTFTTTEQVAEINWSYDLDEDSVVAVLPSLRQEMARSAAEQMDAFVLNADATNAATGNINLDDADPDDDSYYLSSGQDGIRHFYLVDNTGQSADINTTLTDALLRAGIGRLGKYGAMTDRLLMITNAKTYVLSMMSLANVVTVDKFGPQATVLTGQLAAYGGIPIIASESMALAEDDGKVSTTGANNDEGQIAIAHRDMWKVGFRRRLLIEVDKNIQKRQFIMVPSFRIAVATRKRTSQVHTAGIHGITY